MRSLSTVILVSILIIAVYPVLAQTSTESAGASNQFSDTALGLVACPPGPENPASVSPQDRADIISFMAGNIAYWSHRESMWLALHWSALTLSLLGSVLAASEITSNNAGRMKWKSYSALVAAIGTSFLATFNPQAQATRLGDAFVYLKVAVEAYQFDPTMTRCRLLRAYATAESVAQHGMSSPAQAQR